MRGYTHSTAEIDTLDSYVGKLRSGHFRYHHIDHPVTRIIVTGNTALALGEMHADVTVGAVRKKLANRSLAVREAHDWRLLAYQPTVIRADNR